MKIHWRKKAILMLVLWGGALSNNLNANEILGTGASFPAPLYEKWAQLYKEQTGITVTYKPVNSGAGVSQVMARKVDFGASDRPLEKDVLDKNALMQFPTAIGGVVPVVSLRGIKAGDLKLTGEVLANIFMGNILSWNDKAITDLNPGVKLPDLLITVVHRSDDSGTTFLFTDYLSKESKVWKDKYGANGAIAWPLGVGGIGNGGVASYVDRIEGAVGYVEFAHAKKQNLAYIQLKNPSGQFVMPSSEAFEAAAGFAKWESVSDFQLILTNIEGKTVWPMTGATFVLLPKGAEDAAKSKEVLNFFEWAYDDGGVAASELDYVPMPKNVVDIIKRAWAKKIKRS
jgi:phosphate transport system substrate-binding protein